MSPGRTNEGIDVAKDHASTALESYLKSDTELQDAVQRFIQPIYDLYAEKLPNESQLADALDALWTALLDIAQSTPYDDPSQDRLVSFIKTVKSLPPPDCSTPEIWGRSLWSDLPVLGASLRERWNIGPNNENNHWLNLNALAAGLTASQVLDLSLYAIWAMRDGLEVPFEDIKPIVRDQTLCAAALWIKFCGEHIHSLKRIWEPDPGKGNVARGGPLYGGPNGFCKERWELWRERFGVLIQQDGLEERTREMLRDAKRRVDAL